MIQSHEDTWIVTDRAATADTQRLTPPTTEPEFATIHLLHQWPWPKQFSASIRVPLSVQTTLSLWLMALFTLLFVVLMMEFFGYPVSGVLS